MRVHLQEWKNKIDSRSATVSVIGLGHVGLPLALTFVRAGYRTVGVESNPHRLEMLRAGKSCMQTEVTDEVLREAVLSNKLETLSTIPKATRKSDCILVCVPTPIDRENRPNTKIISRVLEAVGHSMNPGSLVVIESTVYPSFTDNFAKRVLETSGMKAGSDFALAYSPSRIDPGNRRYNVSDIPKVVGGVDPLSGEIATLVYHSVIKAGVVKVTDARTAECVKMLENVYRFVNIALVNEVASLYRKIGTNMFEVVSAASSKPFGFSPHYPGPGVGGPCIPKDPFYLEHAAHEMGMRLRLIEASAAVNQRMPLELVSEIQKRVGRNRPKSPRISVFGLAYKAETAETVNSPSAEIISQLISRKMKVVAYDPHVLSIRTDSRIVKSERSVEAAATSADCLIFLVDHLAFKNLDLTKLRKLTAQRCVLYDAKNIFESREVERAGFEYVALGKPHGR